MCQIFRRVTVSIIAIVSLSKNEFEPCLHSQSNIQKSNLIELNPWIDFEYGNWTKLKTELELCEFSWIRFTIRLTLLVSSRKLMRRSNRNFNIPPPPPGQSPGIWLSSVPGEWGIWPLPAWGGENWTGSVRIFFFRVPKSPTVIKNLFGRDGRV